MSHFTVLVKVTADKVAEHNGDVEEAVRAMLAPYQENNMGDCPEEYLAFNDKTTEEIEEQATEIITADSYMGEAHPDWVGKTFLEAYGTIEGLAKDYHGYKKKDEKTGKYGYWENPNRKWDWYQVGGRWSGLLRVNEMADTAQRGEHSWIDDNPVDEPHTADIASVADIDFEGMDLETDIHIEEFWEKYCQMQKVKAGELEKDAHWSQYEIDITLFDLGLMKTVKEGERDPKTREWITKPEFEYTPFTLEDLKANYRWHWEFGTWAVLDDEGWHEKGQMGWWGLSTATPEDRKEWSKSYIDTFLRHEKPDTHLAIVDCHI